jgi:molecular chaperone GrpE
MFPVIQKSSKAGDMSDSRKTKTADASRAADPPTTAEGPGEAPGDGSDGAPAGKPGTEDAALESKDKELKETYDRLLRTTAEFENYKKRMAREMDEFRKYANQSLLREMLSIVDHIELALQAAGGTESQKTIADGLNLTLKEILRILERFNVTPVEAAGKPFNPEVHEAILREPSDSLPENTIVREMQKGYMINGRLLRPSLVVVAAPAAKPVGGDQTS